MDIRQYLTKKPRLDKSFSAVYEDKKESEEVASSSNSPPKLYAAPVSATSSAVSGHSSSHFPSPPNKTANRLDIGIYVSERQIPDEIKFMLITNPWCPSFGYDFKADIEPGKRAFSKHWLTTYSSWLAYSEKLKGAFCRHCVVFKPNVDRGNQGAFITTPFKRNKHFVEQMQVHLKSSWHLKSIEKSQRFVNVMTNKEKAVDVLLDEARNAQIEKNRNILKAIVSTVCFCGTHEIALRGKMASEGNFIDLLQLRIESGDDILLNHFKTCPKNAKYISVQTQNEIIELCGENIQNKIIQDVKRAKYFAILADETADIAGTEQMSVGVRYVNLNLGKICEESLGFIPLQELDAKSLAEKILGFISELGLDPAGLIGQGYDGCSAMAGKENGVQARIREHYPKALFFHCASHKLNLVINDLNDVGDIRNATGSIKSVIHFFRESTLRRSKLLNLPLLSETRWSEKYKSIRISSMHFKDIMEVLDNISKTGNNSATRSKATQLYTTMSSSSFLISLQVIATYSAKLEPVVNILQGIQINLPNS